ncbi:MAG: hypothetical protein AAGM38_05890 [Pseudomonadota bacterium]
MRLIIPALMLLCASIAACVWLMARSLKSAEREYEPVDDLPAKKVPWRPDQSVFETPASFGYKIFTTAHDEVIEAAHAPATKGRSIRAAFIRDRLSRCAPAADRLAAAITRGGVGAGSTMSLLIDHSGSLRGASRRPAEIITPEESGARQAVDTALTLACALDRCGARFEILGFTTRAWNGGRSRTEWLAAGRPKRPGRLNDLLHIIYKPMEEPFGDHVALRLEALLQPSLLKENIDGEAIAWARARLLERPPATVPITKGGTVIGPSIIVISDGAPVDDATCLVNGVQYLSRHLSHVVDDIVERRDLRIVGIGLNVDVSDVYPRAAKLPERAELSDDDVDAIAAVITS